MDTPITTPGLEQLLHSAGKESSDFIGTIVAAAKDHLETDISFLAEFQKGDKVIRRAAGDGPSVGLEEGTKLPLNETYCYRMVAGDLPNVIQDARNDDRVKDLPITAQLKIGSYVGVPVTIPGGRTYGTLCCISHEKDTSLRPRDVKFMRVLADLIGAQLRHQESATEDRQLKIDRIQSVIREKRAAMVFQPIVELGTGRIIGAESLARFEIEPRRTPDRWFAEAWEVGLGIDLEIVAVRTAIAQLPNFAESVYLSVNVSPDTLRSAVFAESLAGVPSDRIVVEITEHAAVEEYGPLIEAIGTLRNKGIRLAVDDVGAGHSGLNHIIRVAPQILKLDVMLIRGVDSDLVKQALISAATAFASRVHVSIVAEGIETKEEANALKILGIRYGQGYYYSKPGPLPLRVRDD